MNSNIKYLVESFIDDEEEITDIDLNFDYRSMFVDLGLPSGTKWARCNLGTNNPEEFGLYYQWGSLEGHKSGTFDFNEHTYFEEYDVNNYKGLTELRKENDVAYVLSKGLCRMPTEKLLQELIDNCEYEWTELNGVAGALYTGPNGNSIFFPAAGYCDGESIIDIGRDVSFWTLTIYSPHESYYMFCHCSFFRTTAPNHMKRYFGFSIRPVLNKNN